jgi:hypothetical protein
MESYHNLLKRIDEVQERLTKDKDGAPETRGHHTYNEIRYWFDHYGQVKPKR